MSVLKSKRNISKMEFFHNALKLRRMITEFLLRDFGIKNRRRDIEFVNDTISLDQNDLNTLYEIFEKYNIDKPFLDVFPDWLIDKERIYIMDILRDLIKNITVANTIYATNEAEYYLRRNHQDLAICNCEDLLQEMQYIISVCHPDTEKYMQYVDMINKEIALLKGWRKSDNKILRDLQNK